MTTPAITRDRLSQQIRLSDGRMLGFAEYGDPEGAALLYCHGWPSSRLEPRTVENLLASLPVRVIAPDRPGYGLSTFQHHRTIGDWPSDVNQLADHLGLTRFAVLGVSGGGPYAAACAARIPERLSVVGLVCALAPLDSPEVTDGMVALNRRLLSFARHTPWLAQKLGVLCLQALWGKGEQVIPEQIESRLPAADKRALASPELRQALIASSVEGLRVGLQGAARDGFLYARPWGIRLQDIRSTVKLWHGEKDVVVPPAMGRYLAKTIPGCQANFFPEDGHFSLPYTRLREILGSLLA
jgi:pimeloyl-ACP methyl ester carboxylesterase